MNIDKNIQKLITSGIERMEGSAGVGKLFRKHIPQPWRNVIIAVVCEYYDSDYNQAGMYIGNLTLEIFDNYIPPPPSGSGESLSGQTLSKPNKTLQLFNTEDVELTNILIETLHRQSMIVGNYFLIYGPDHKPENAHKLLYDNYEEHLEHEAYMRDLNN